MANTPFDSLPANELINSVSGNIRYSAAANADISPAGNILLNPTGGFVTQTNNAQLIQTATVSGAAVQRFKLNGDTNYRGGISGDAIFVWGSGSAAEDTYLSRTGAKKLNLRGVGATDATFDVTGNIVASTSISGNSISATTSVTGATIIGTTSVTTPLIQTSASDLNINASTGFVRFNSNNLTGIGTAIGTALDFTSLINTNIAGTISLTIGSAIDDLRLTVGTGKSVDYLNNPAVNIYSAAFKGAANGATIFSVQQLTDTGNRFYIENSGNHFWCSAGDGTITHAFTIDAGVDGNFVLSNSGGTAGRLTCVTEVLTNQVTGTSSNNLVLTTNNASNLVEITRIPILSSLSDNIEAFATGGQASATVLTSYYNAVTTVANAGDSVKMGTTSTMPISSVIVVKNCTATNSMNIFPDSGSQFFYITLQAADTSISVAPGNALTFYRRTSTIWDVY